MAHKTKSASPRSQSGAPAGRREAPAGPREVTGSAEATPPDQLRPWLLGGFMALLVARPLLPSETAAVFGEGALFVMLWIMLALGWLLSGIIRGRLLLRTGWIDLALAALVLAIGASGLAAVREESPRPALNMTWEWFGLALAFFLARQLPRTQRERRAVAACMVALAAVLSAYGIYQYAYSLPHDREAYLTNPDKALSEAGLNPQMDSRERYLFEQRLASTEPMARFELANSLAGFLTPWLLVALGASVLAIRRRPGGLAGFALLALAAVMTACLVLTKSRSAYLAVAAGLAALLVLWPDVTWKIKAWVALVGVLALATCIAAGLATGALDREVVSEGFKSFEYRWEYWQATWSLIQDKPLLGTGPGNFQENYSLYKLPQASELVADPHNFLLEVWATAGSFALVALMAVLVCALVRLWRPAGAPNPAANPAGEPEAEVDTLRYLAGGGLAGVLVAFCAGITGSVPLPPELLLAGLVALLVAIAALWGWIQDGQMPAGIPAVAAGALLINFLAAGGISFPGVANSLWLVLALALGERGACKAYSVGRSGQLLALIVVVAAGVGCHVTAYHPVQQARLALLRAENDPARAEKHFMAARDADPWSDEPWRILAQLEYERWKLEPLPKTFELFVEYNREALARRPHSTRSWLRTGDYYWQAFLLTKRPEDAQAAAASYRRAVELYPNFATGRAGLAIALAATGDFDAALVQADEALRLDAIMPHTDQKLNPKLREVLLHNTGSGNGSIPEVPAPGGPAVGEPASVSRPVGEPGAVGVEPKNPIRKGIDK